MLKRIWMVLFCSSLAQAGDRDGTWKLEGQLGGVLTSGNTNTSTLDLGIRLNKSLQTGLGLLETTNALKALYKEENGTTSARRLQYDSRVERALDENRAWFYSAQLLRDDFSGFERQDSSLLGYRHQWKQGAHDLKLRPALGYRISTRQDSTDNQEEFIASLGVDWTWTWSQTARMENQLKTDWGESNTHSTLTLAVLSQLMDKLSLKISLLLDHNSQVAADRENLDTTTSINLVYQLH